MSKFKLQRVKIIYEFVTIEAAIYSTYFLTKVI